MILIIAEHDGSKLKRSTHELLSAALAIGSNLPVAMLVLGSNVASVASEAARLVSQVLVADRPELSQYDPDVWAGAVAQVAREGEAQYVFIAGDRAGREYSPRVAVNLDAALLEDVVSIERRGDKTAATHYTYLARVTEEVETDARTIVVTVKAGAFPAAAESGENGEQFDVDLQLRTPRVQITARRSERTARVGLADADIVVAGGRGVGSAEGFTQYVEALADELGAAVGATRAVVDAGWRPYSEQVGQTGKTVQPKAYIAVGISGAVQHLSGMNKSKFIIAINRDAECPMLRLCDYGVVGDVSELVPAIIKALRM